MTDSDVLILRRELERTMKKLEASLKLNAVLENANRDLERLNNDKAAWKGVICGEVGRVRGIVKKLRSNSEFSSGASVTDHYEPPSSLMAIEGPSTTDVRRDPHAMRSHQADKFLCKNCRKVFKFKSVLDGHRRFCVDTKEIATTTSRENMMDIDDARKNSLTAIIPSPIKSQRTSKVLGHFKPLPKFRKCPHCPYVTDTRNYIKHVRLHWKPNFRPRPNLWGGANFVPKSSTVDHGSKSALEGYEPPLSIMANEGPPTAVASRDHPQVLEGRQVRKFQCSNCRKVFKFKSVLGGHRRFCGGVNRVRAIASSQSKVGSSVQDHKTIECEYDGCDFKTKWTSSLRVHVLRVHQNHRPWACGWEECERIFSTREFRDEHVRRIHTGERPFGCPDCDKWFAAAGSLAKHRQSLVHLKRIEIKKSKARSAKTKLMAKSKPGLSNRGKEHSKSNEKLFECDYDGCDFKTKWSNSIRLHVQCVHKDHRPFVCEYEDCDLAFKTKREFEDHIRAIHTGERPFGCEDCDLWFSSKKYLATHLKTKKHLNRS